MEEALLDAHATLRLATLAGHASFVGGPDAQVQMRERLEPVHREGTVFSAEHQGRVVAVLAWMHDPMPRQYGVPVSTVALAYDPAWSGIESWLAGVLDRELPRMEADLDLLLDVSYSAAYRALRAHGLGVDAVQLLGDPREALARLLADREVPRLPAAVAIEPIAREHLDDAVDLFRDAFTAQPEHCWFGANPRHLESLREDMEAHLDQPAAWVVTADRRVLGLLNSKVRDDPFYGPIAGVGIVLAPELRGRGLLRTIYRHLLGSMVERGAVTFRSGTSQPPVMRLAKVLGRPCASVIMRRGAAFPESHFAGYLPE